MKSDISTLILCVSPGEKILIDSKIEILVTNKKSKKPINSRVYIKAPRNIKIEIIKKSTEGLINEKNHCADVHSKERET